MTRDLDEAAVRCENAAGCPAQQKAALEHYVSRKAMDIDGVGEKLLHQLFDEGLISSVADLYTLSHEALANLERMGPKSAQKALSAIEASKKLSCQDSYMPSEFARSARQRRVIYRRTLVA